MSFASQVLSKCLSLNLRLCDSARLDSQQAWESLLSSLHPHHWPYTHMPSYLDILLVSQGSNSGLHGCKESALLTGPPSSLTANFSIDSEHETEKEEDTYQERRGNRRNAFLKAPSVTGTRACNSMPWRALWGTAQGSQTAQDKLSPNHNCFCLLMMFCLL